MKPNEPESPGPRNTELHQTDGADRKMEAKGVGCDRDHSVNLVYAGPDKVIIGCKCGDFNENMGEMENKTLDGVVIFPLTEVCHLVFPLFSHCML